MWVPLPPGIIVCEQTIDVKIESVPWTPSDLGKAPPGDDTWLGYLVPVDQLNSKPWTLIKDLPFIHIIGEIRDGSCVVAVASCIQQPFQELYGEDFSPEPAPEPDVLIDLLELTEDEKAICDVCTMRQKISSSLIRKAVTGVTSPGGRGLARYYRSILDKHHLVPIEWALLIDDITTSPSAVRDQFLLSSLFLSLHLLDDLSGFDPSDASDLCKREPDIWIALLRQRESATTAQLVENADIEMHTIALVRGLLEFAGHNTGVRYYRYNRKNTFYDNVGLIGRIFDVGLTNLVPRPFGASEVRDFLVRSGHSDRDISHLCDGLAIHLPIAVPMRYRESLLASLVNRIATGEVMAALGVIGDTYEKLPQLDKKENDGLLLLNHLAKRRVGLEVLREWMASTEGQRVYSQTLKTMWEHPQPTEQFILGLVTLIHYLFILDSSSEGSAPTYCFSFDDFSPLLGDNTVDRRDVLERVGCSARAVLASDPAMASGLDTLIGRQSSVHWLDGYNRPVFGASVSHNGDSCWRLQENSSFPYQDDAPPVGSFKWMRELFGCFTFMI
ncbi:hypothetical protein FPOAC2_13595 [Fusarium poae]